MRTLVLVVLALVAPAAPGACVSQDPTVVARWLYEKAPGFSHNPASGGDHLAIALRKLIERDQKLCPKGDVCAIDWDPWTDAQDGEIVGPVAFSVAERTTTTAVVRMQYRFLNSSNPLDATDEVNTLRFELQKKTGCWGLIDLESRRGPSESLKRTFERWSDKDYGT